MRFNYFGLILIIDINKFILKPRMGVHSNIFSSYFHYRSWWIFEVCKNKVKLSHLWCLLNLRAQFRIGDKVFYNIISHILCNQYISLCLTCDILFFVAIFNIVIYLTIQKELKCNCRKSMLCLMYYLLV